MHRIRSDENVACLWDSDSGVKIADLVHGGDVRGTAFEAGRILTWADDQNVRVWDEDTGSEIGVLFHGETIRGGWFLAGGRKAITWSGEGTVRVWNLEAAATALSWVEEYVRRIELSSDQMRVCTISSSQSSLWDVTTGDLLGRIEAPDVIAVASDKAQILDGLGRLWQLSYPLELAVQRASEIVGRTRPLSPKDQREAALIDGPDLVVMRQSERTFAINKDRFTPLRKESAERIIGSVGARSPDVKLELVVNQRKEAFVFHNKEFSSPLKRIEVNRLAKAMYFVHSAGRVINFGIRIDERLLRYLEGSDQVLVVLMNEETGEPISGDYFPVLQY